VKAGAKKFRGKAQAATEKGKGENQGKPEEEALRGAGGRKT